MLQSLTSLHSLLMTIVLATLAIGLPIVFVLAIRFLWDRTLSLSRSKELEKLIWQLHRIASAMEHQMNLAFPAVQPGTEEPTDIAYLQGTPAQGRPAARSASASAAGAPVAQLTEQQRAAAQQAGASPAPSTQASGDAARHGVNSMFGL
jgi:hypothetical protein